MPLDPPVTNATRFVRSVIPSPSLCWFEPDCRGRLTAVNARPAVWWREAPDEGLLSMRWSCDRPSPHPSPGSGRGGKIADAPTSLFGLRISLFDFCILIG